MFGEARPLTAEHTIEVACPPNAEVQCARCTSHLLWRDVAMFTRTRPGDAFDPWCADCAHQLVSWAGRGAALDIDFPFDQDVFVLTVRDDLGSF